MSLMCDSILNPVCVLAVNIRFDLFFPLIVSGMSLYRNAWVFMTGRSSTRTGGAAAAAAFPFSCPLVSDAAAAARAGSNRPNCLREYFILKQAPFDERVPVYTGPLRNGDWLRCPSALHNLLQQDFGRRGRAALPVPVFDHNTSTLHEPFDVFHVKLAVRPTQTLACHGSVISELDITAGTGIVLGPFGQTCTVQACPVVIARLRKVGPILLHGIRDFPVGRSVVGAHVAEDVRDLRSVRRAQGFPARRGPIELVFVAWISRAGQGSLGRDARSGGRVR